MMELNVPRRGRRTINCGYSIGQTTADFITAESERLDISKSSFVSAVIEAYREQQEAEEGQDVA